MDSTDFLELMNEPSPEWEKTTEPQIMQDHFLRFFGVPAGDVYKMTARQARYKLRKLYRVHQQSGKSI